jgi:hypothetical protein
MMISSLSIENSSFVRNFYDSIVAFEKKEWTEDSCKAIMVPE